MSEKTRQKTAIVIGAGVGGVSTAARLAHAGFHVTVLEKNSFTGGRCSLIKTDSGYRFDQGPSLLLLPRLFHQTFEELGTTLEKEGVELRKCEPNYRIWFGDGVDFEMSTDLTRMKTEIEKWEGKDGYERYLGWLQESHRHYELSVEHVLLKNFTSLADMLRPSFLMHLFTLHPFESIWTRAGKYFWTERMKRVFTFGNIGERKGVEYKLNSAVSKIVLDDKGSRAVGVEIEGGDVMRADVVINNSDLVYAYTSLLATSPSASPTPYAESLAKRPASCSSISFYWGLSQKVPGLEAHNIFLADEYKKSFDAIFKKHLIPDAPSFYVNVPTRVDASAAPEGKDSVVVLVPVGHLLDGPSAAEKEGVVADGPTTDGELKGGTTSETIKSVSPYKQTGIQPSNVQDWPAMIALARQTIISTIQTRTGVDLGPLIVHEETNDPITWKQKFNLDKGAILGLSHSFFNVLSFRPSTRARKGSPFLDGRFGGGVPGRLSELVGDLGRWDRDIKGLYMVGASAHPGTGVPICLTGGKLVAEQVLQDLRVQVPWEGKKERVRRIGKLDREERPMPLGLDSEFMSIVAVIVWAVAIYICAVIYI
ncbi:hypothetical protein LTR81_011170 [Elasticomyces elasticus]